MDDDALRPLPSDPLGFGCVRPNLASPEPGLGQSVAMARLSLGQAPAQGEAEKESNTAERIQHKIDSHSLHTTPPAPAWITA